MIWEFKSESMQCLQQIQDILPNHKMQNDFLVENYDKYVDKINQCSKSILVFSANHCLFKILTTISKFEFLFTTVRLILNIYCRNVLLYVMT